MGDHIGCNVRFTSDEVGSGLFIHFTDPQGGLKSAFCIDGNPGKRRNCMVGPQDHHQIVSMIFCLPESICSDLPGIDVPGMWRDDGKGPIFGGFRCICKKTMYGFFQQLWIRRIEFSGNSRRADIGTTSRSPGESGPDHNKESDPSEVFHIIFSFLFRTRRRRWPSRKTGSSRLS